MFGKFDLFFKAFQQGQQLADSKRWKSHQNTANDITAFLAVALLIAKAYGVEIPIGESELTAVGVLAYAVINRVLTTVTSDKVGVLPSSK